MKRILLGTILALFALSAFAGTVTDTRGKPVVTSDGKPVSFDGSGKQSSAGSSD